MKQKQNGDKKLRLFWSSNAGWSTSGYGVQTGLTVPQIKAEGYEIAVNNFFGLEGAIVPGLSIPGWEAIPQYPKFGDVWGADQCVLGAKHFNADCVITLQDIWVLDGNWLNQMKNWIPWVPIDHSDVTPAVLDRLKLCYRIIAMSKYGQQKMLEKGFTSTYIPHSVDTQVLQPINKFAARKQFNLPPNGFVFGIVGANKEVPSRKGFEQALIAFKKFHDTHPDSVLYCHVSMQQGGGVDLINFAAYLGIQQAIFYAEPYQLFNATRQDMNVIYNTFDVLLQPSRSEGFGVPVIEAQACGVPVIVNDFAAMPELVIPGKTGEVAKRGLDQWSPQLSNIVPADIDSLLEQINKVYQKGPGAYAEAARAHTVKTYDTKTVFKQYWLPFLKLLETELHPN